MDNTNNANEKYCHVCGRIANPHCNVNGKPVCNKHYNQYRKYGKFLDNNPRTIYDPNEYHTYGNITYIDIYNKYCEVIAQAKIDTEDLPKVKNIKWKLSPNGYACNTPKYGNSTHMTHVIMNASREDIVDHINHDVLDNRKCNLRIVDKSKNQMNSNYKGVYGSNPYRASIKIFQTGISLGDYYIEAEAYWARWYTEYILFGKYRYLMKQEPNIPYERKMQIKQYVDKRIQDIINKYPNLPIQQEMDQNKVIQIVRVIDYNGVHL